MKIKGTEGLSSQDIEKELQRGAKFVVFQYSISIIIMSFKNSSDIYFIKAGEGTFGKSIGFTLLSLILGWWGIPWGPIYTIGSLYTNLTGGKDVTSEVLSAISQPAPVAG